MNTDEHRFFKRFLNKYLRLSVFICGLIFFSSCNFFYRDNQTNSNQNSNENTFEIPKSNINLEKPLEISDKKEDVELCKEIDKTIDESEFKKARWGIIAVSLKDGRVVCGKDAQQLFTPASVEKLLTSIVALDKLGEDFRWKTSVYAKSEIKNGTLDGNLILYGRGSPDFDDGKLNNLVNSTLSDLTELIKSAKKRINKGL
jgi:D-alanyl-D-alanine carboxypeptidase